jgi:hypothetical protein
MGIKLNLGDIDIKKFDPIPAGTYDAKVTGGELKSTSGEGKLGKVPMINWEFTIQDEEYVNRKVWMNTVIHETTLFNLKALLATGKFSEEDMAAELDFEIEDIIGEEVRVVVAQREYNGEVRNEVKRVKGMTDEPGTATAKGRGKKSLLP